MMRLQRASVIACSSCRARALPWSSALPPRPRVPDLRRGGLVSTPKRPVEIGQIAEARVVSDVTDAARRAPRIAQHAKRGVQPVLQDELCVRHALLFEQLLDVARRDAVAGGD